MLRPNTIIYIVPYHLNQHSSPCESKTTRKRLPPSLSSLTNINNQVIAQGGERRIFKYWINVNKHCTLTSDHALFLSQNLVFVLEDRDSEEFVLVIQGYVALLTDREVTVNTIKSSLDETRKFSYPHKYFSLHTHIFLLDKQIQIFNK